MFRLRGGPQHGRVIAEADVGSVLSRPAMLLGEPRDESFLDKIVGVLRWNPEVEWYERSTDVE